MSWTKWFRARAQRKNWEVWKLKMRSDIALLAEAKLGRSMTVSERGGLEKIHSGMMLESVWQKFAFEGTTAHQVDIDLGFFASLAYPER